jgi:hypothetical protein
MPSRKRRKRYEEEEEEPQESIFSLLAEGLAAGIVQTFTAEAQKVAKGFMARQGNALEKKDEEPKTPEIVVESEPTSAPVEEPTDENVIEGEFRYVD